MPRGQPDFGAYQQKTVGGTLADLGEAVARLDSIVTFDRRGDVIDLDDFEGTVIIGEITAGQVALDSTHVRSGSQALKITTAAAIGNNPHIAKRLSSFGSKRQGAEIHFSNPTAVSHLEFYLEQDDAVARLFSEVEFYFNTGVIRVSDRFAGWVNIATVATPQRLASLYYPIKLVVDFSTGMYVRLLLMDTEYDLSAYTMGTALPAAAPQTRCVMTYQADAAVISTLWLDDFIFTINEP